MPSAATKALVCGQARLRGNSTAFVMAAHAGDFRHRHARLLVGCSLGNRAGDRSDPCPAASLTRSHVKGSMLRALRAESPFRTNTGPGKCTPNQDLDRTSTHRHRQPWEVSHSIALASIATGGFTWSFNQSCTRISGAESCDRASHDQG